jgi:hypothetical protein
MKSDNDWGNDPRSCSFDIKVFPYEKEIYIIGSVPVEVFVKLQDFVKMICGKDAVLMKSEELKYYNASMGFKSNS